MIKEKQGIRIQCVTRLDDHRYLKWPSHLQVLPRTGERLKCVGSPHEEATIEQIVHGEGYVYLHLGPKFPLR